MATPDESADGEPAKPAGFTTTALGEDRPEGGNSAPEILTRGAVVARYVVLEKIGAGGMGIVYAAFDPELDRRIALKLLHPRTHSKRPGVASARLLREAQALAQLSHPAVITVHDVGTYQAQVFVAMEFVDGVDLGTWVAEHADGWEKTLGAYLDAGGGLAAAHRAGIVHRDFKPDNVLVDRDGRVRVLDFGLARSSEGSADDALDDALDDARATRGPSPPQGALSGETSTPSAAPPTHTSRTRLEVVVGRATQLSSQLTQAGAVMGTPAYMAPEQHEGARTDARTDQFSFCLALYESLYGERPYAGRTRTELLSHMLEGEVRPPPREGPVVPAWIRRVLLRGLSTSPAARWPDMDTLLAALAPKPKSTRRGPIVTVVALSATLGVVVLTRSDPVEMPCQGAQRKLSGVWDDTIRATVRGAFEATQRPYAAKAFSTTQSFLDDYTARWVRMHTEACEATAVRKEQSQELLDRQIGCLGRRLKDVGALTRLLSEADAETVRDAVKATAKLPQLGPCMDAHLVMSGAAPLSGRRATQAAAIDEQIARARQLEAFGRYEEAVATATRSRAAAVVLDQPARRARTTELLGWIQLRNGDTENATKTLLEAVWLADVAHADLIRARAWVSLLWAVGYEQERGDNVDDLRHHAEAALLRAGGDPLLAAQLHENLGGIARKRYGDPRTAVVEHERALQIRRAQLGDASPRVARSLANLGAARSDAGQYDAAERDLDEAMRLFTDQLGDAHPEVAAVLHNRGLLAFRKGGKERPSALLRESIRIMEAALTPDHPDLAITVHDLGEVLLAAEDYSSALPEFRRAAKLRRAALGQNHGDLANSLTGVGRALAGLGRQDEAVATLEEALAIHRTLQTKGGLRAETQGALAASLAARDPARAHTLALSAMATFSAAGRPDDARALQDLLAHLHTPDPSSPDGSASPPSAP